MNNNMSIVDHLEELRWRILKSLGSIVLMSILTFNFANYLVDILILEILFLILLTYLTL